MIMRQLVLALIVMIGWSVQAAMGASYHFKPGDTIQISVWQEPRLNRQVLVAPDGSIELPLAGRIQAEGRTTKQVELAIKKRLSEQYKSALDITVSLAAQSNANQLKKTIYVMGEVNRPGPFVIEQPTTLVQALALSGGPGVFAATHRIQVHRKIRGHDQIFKFDYAVWKSGGEPGANIFLRPGDVVIVPERGLFEFN